MDVVSDEPESDRFVSAKSEASTKSGEGERVGLVSLEADVPTKPGVEGFISAESDASIKSGEGERVGGRVFMPDL